MDKFSIAEFISIVFAGSIISMIFPEGKYKNILKMLLSFMIIVSVFTLISGDILNIDFDIFKSSKDDYVVYEENVLKDAVIAAAQKDTENFIEKNYGIIPEITEVSVIEYDNDYYIDNIRISFMSVPDEYEKIKTDISKRFGVPAINVFICEVIKDS